VSPNLIRITTFYPRRGRVSARHEDALERLAPSYAVEVAPPWEPLSTAELFGRSAPLVLEIGSGMGDATALMAAADPDRDYLAVEVFPPGVANLLARVEEQGLTNVRVAIGDALELLRHMLPPAGVDAIHVFFPDPWPKAKHHKRRLISPEFLPTLRDALVVGGTLHCATDWAHYADQMLAVLSADPHLHNPYGGFAPRPDSRPVTKFERRGIDAGRQIFDLLVTRTS
jgi:tRNA (guanine-N7-)-methyltransferase